jgi:hypothetical protein
MAASVAMGSTLYDGIRHLEFIYPVLVLLAVAGWSGILSASRPRWLRRGAAAALTMGIASVLIVQVRLHPNQGVYFNSLVGGPRGAFGRYDMDYWGNCMLQAVEWSAAAARAYGTAVTISGNPSHLVQLNADRFSEVDFTYPNRNRHYLQLQLARGPAAAISKLAAEPALFQVRTPDGAVLCVVTPGPAYGELEATRRAAPGAANHQSTPQ